MPAAAIAAVATVGSAAVASNASKKAAKAQAQAAESANDLQWRMYEQSRADQAPWRDAGQNALTQLMQRVGQGGDLSRSFTMGDFQADPGYQFRLSEGMKGLENSAAARGGLLSGAALKAASQYNQNFASGEFNNAFNRFNANQTNQFNRLASLAGVGQQAATQIGNQAMQTGQIVGNNITGAGNARASGYVGSANAVNNGITQGMNWWQGNQLLNALNQPAYGVAQQPGVTGWVSQG